MKTLLHSLVLFASLTPHAFGGDDVPLAETVTQLTRQVLDGFNEPPTAPGDCIKRGYARLFLGDLDGALRDFKTAGTTREAILCEMVALEAKGRGEPENSPAKLRFQRLRQILLDPGPENDELYQYALYLQNGGVSPAQRTLADQLTWLATLRLASPELLQAAHAQGEPIAERLTAQLWNPAVTPTGRKHPAVIAALKTLRQDALPSILASLRSAENAWQHLTEDTAKLASLIGVEEARDRMLERREYLQRVLSSLEEAHDIARSKAAP